MRLTRDHAANCPVGGHFACTCGLDTGLWAHAVITQCKSLALRKDADTDAILLAIDKAYEIGVAQGRMQYAEEALAAVSA